MRVSLDEKHEGRRTLNRKLQRTREVWKKKKDKERNGVGYCGMKNERKWGGVVSLMSVARRWSIAHSRIRKTG